MLAVWDKPRPAYVCSVFSGARINHPDLVSQRVAEPATVREWTKAMESAMQCGLGDLVKSVTFDVKTLDRIRGADGSDEGKVFNHVH